MGPTSISLAVYHSSAVASIDESLPINSSKYREQWRLMINSTYILIALKDSERFVLLIVLKPTRLSIKEDSATTRPIKIMLFSTRRVRKLGKNLLNVAGRRCIYFILSIVSPRQIE